MRLEVRGILEYIDEQIAYGTRERAAVSDNNCYAAGYNDAIVDEFRNLREYITGETA